MEQEEGLLASTEIFADKFDLEVKANTSPALFSNSLLLPFNCNISQLNSIQFEQIIQYYKKQITIT